MSTNGVAAPDIGDRVRLLFSLELERSFWGGVMQCAEEEQWPRIEEAMGFIARQDFHRPEHRLVFDAVTTIRDKGLSPGLEAVTTQLEQHGKFTDSFVRFDVEQMLREACRPLIPLEPAKQIKELAQMRALISAHDRVKRIYETATDPVAAFQHALDVLEQVRPPQPSSASRNESTWDELMAMQFPPRVSVVQHFFDEARTYLLVGGPKAGKSMFVIQCAIAMASGSNALVHLATGKPRDVLYACLDDNDQENTKARARAIFNAVGPSIRPHMTFKWRFEPEESKARYFREWAETHPGGFIFIDILENVRDGFPPPKGTQDRLYAADYWALRWTSDLAHGPSRCGVGVVHHNRKTIEEGGNPLNTASGTNALMGAVDVGIVFHDRQLHDPINRVTVTGRNQAQESYELEWNDLVSGWEFLGVAKPPSGSKPRPLSRQRQAIADACQQSSKPLQAHEIATLTGQDPTATRMLLRKMWRDKQIAQYTDRTYDHPAEVSRRSYAHPLVADDAGDTGPDNDEGDGSPEKTDYTDYTPPVPD